MAVRLIAGAWCLAAFVLVPAYSGTLTSFLTSPIARPIVDSYHDIPDRVISAGKKVAVEGGLGVDKQFQLWVSNVLLFILHRWFFISGLLLIFRPTYQRAVP